MRQSNYEQALDKQGVQWEYVESVPITDINHTRGKQMQARLEPLDHNLIDRYSEMLVDGLIPPPLLLWKQGRGMWIPLDGNQRLAANTQTPAKHRLKEFSAYILKTDDPMIADRICWSWNNLINGKRLSYDECMQHAITFVRKYGMQQKSAAKEWGVKSVDICKEIIRLEMRELAQANNIHLPPALAEDSILNLNPLRAVGDDVAAKALKAAAENGLSCPQVLELVKEVKKASSTKDKLKAVDDFTKQEKILRTKAETKGGHMRHVRGRLPREQLQKQLDTLDSLVKEFDKKALQPVGKDDRDEYHATALRVCNKLIEIYGLGSFLHSQKEDVA